MIVQICLRLWKHIWHTWSLWPAEAKAISQCGRHIEPFKMAATHEAVIMLLIKWRHIMLIKTKIYEQQDEHYPTKKTVQKCIDGCNNNIMCCDGCDTDSCRCDSDGFTPAPTPIHLLICRILCNVRQPYNTYSYLCITCTPTLQMEKVLLLTSNVVQGNNSPELS